MTDWVRRVVSSVILGTAIGAGILGISSSDHEPTDPAHSFTLGHTAAAGHLVSFLGEKVIGGKPTTICTRGTNPRLLQVLQDAIQVWHDRLSPDDNDDGKIDVDALFEFHILKSIDPAACEGADVEVTENILRVNEKSISVECQSGRLVATLR